MEIFNDLEQGTEEWFAVRAGIPTASMFSAILSKGRTKGAPSKTRLTYMYKLAGEIITGEPGETYSNAHMERGIIMEEEARLAYQLQSGEIPELVGFVRNGNKGCSPDAFIQDDGMLEIKTKLPHIMVDVLLSGKVPSEHTAQLQGQLWVAEREWVDFVAYWPRMPLFVQRVYRDEAYIKTLESEVNRFVDELNDVVEQVKQAA